MKTNKGQSKNLKFSVMMSFALAFVSILALLACGFNQISYAADENTFAAANEITISVPAATIRMHDREGVVGSGSDLDNIADVVVFYTNSDKSKYGFCVEHDITAGNDNSKLNLIGTEDSNPYNNDAGILYIIQNSFIYGKEMIPNSQVTIDSSKMTIENADEIWATQMAIWMYLYEKAPTNTKYKLKPGQKTSIEETQELCLYDPAGSGDSKFLTSSKPLYDFFKDIVAEAHNYVMANKVSIIKENNDITKVENDKYYQSSKIRVVGDPEAEFVSYSLDLSGLEGAFAINAADNKKIEDLTSIPKGTEFYIRVPVEKVPEGISSLDAQVSGKFNSKVFNEYGDNSNADLQHIISIDDGTRVIIKKLDIPTTTVPDTGMNTAQTIYFIGLIVLLCGVGIVYANAKPLGDE